MMVIGPASADALCSAEPFKKTDQFRSKRPSESGHRLFGPPLPATDAVPVDGGRTSCAPAGSSARRTPSTPYASKSDTPHARSEVAGVGLTVAAACTPFGWV